jgi:hypothetical protein
MSDVDESMDRLNRALELLGFPQAELKVTAEFPNIRVQLPPYDGVIEIPMDRAPEECPYTFSHTRHWCAHQFCRDS